MKVNHSLTAALVLTVLLVGGPVVQGAAVCAPFCDGLESVAAIEANGGVVLGPVALGAAVSGNGAHLGPPGRIVYEHGFFAADRGSLAFWFRKTSAQEFGGLAQIGVIGQPGSVGLFFNETDRLVFEVRNDADEVAGVAAAGVLSESAWAHIVATWDRRDGGTDLWLFLNGHFHQHAFLAGSFTPAAGRLEIGSTGYYGGGEGAWDELRFFDWNLADSEVYGEYVLSANRHRRAASSKPVSTGNVRIVDGKLLVEGRPFRVKGAGYQPTPVGWPISGAALQAMYTDAAILARDLHLLREMNANTIRLWSNAPDETLLDACYNSGVDPIYVLMGFWVPQDASVDYGNAGTRAAIEADFRDYVRRFKDHPAVLGWGIGNENNLVYDGTMSDWYSLVNALAAAAYDEEGAAYHPAVLVNGGFWHVGDVEMGSDDLSLPMVDVWGVNLYFGEEANGHFDFYEALSAKPLLFTEFGIDAWDHAAGVEHQAVQADYDARQWRQIASRTLGGTVMAYSDEWWKAGTPAIHDFGGYATGIRMHPDGYSNEEWWGIVAPSAAGSGPDVMTPRAAYHALAEAFADRTGDSDGDDDTDLCDLAALQRCWGASAPADCVAAFDFSGDGAVDGEDLEAVAACLNGPGNVAACPP